MPTPQENRAALLELATTLTAGVATAKAAAAESARVEAAEAAEDVTQAAREAALVAEVADLKAKLAAATTTTPPPVTPPTTSTGNVVLRGNKIVKPNGVEVVARGPEATIASASNSADVDAIAATGANAMRMLLTLDAANGMTPQAFDAILARAAFHKLLVWVSLYTWNEGAGNVISSALGGGNFYSLNGGSRSNPAPCYLAVWQRQWLKDLMSKYRANVVIDAAQEYIGGSMDSAAGRDAWAASAITNVKFFRAQGYTQPLEIMSNFQGRDLYAIVNLGARIRAADTVLVDGQPQTMFGWQAYWWGDWYPSWQGSMLLGAGQRISAAQAISQFVAKSPFPIQVGFDNYAGDTNVQYKEQMDVAQANRVGWLWWSWKNGTVEAPVSGATCQDYVLRSPAGFGGAVKG